MLSVVAPPTPEEDPVAGRKRAPSGARTPNAARSRAPGGRARRAAPARRPTMREQRPAPGRAAAAPPARPAPAPGAAPAAAAAPDRAPSAIGAVMQHMDYSSHDLEQVKRFYTETLGFTTFNFDTRFSYLWVRTGPSSSLGFMPPLPGPPEQWRPPREPSIHLIVEDVDRAHRVLSERGVTFEQAPTDMPWGHRTAVLRDPEGRLLCLAQPIPPRRT
jgi:predicted enzyme related to lactoylglutathione lyase